LDTGGFLQVTGLSKYVDAISNLFVKSASSIQLLGLEVVDEDRIVARWRLQGTLKLPWRPSVKAYTGTTLYQLNSQVASAVLVCRRPRASWFFALSAAERLALAS
jgi:hypothetical protein